MIHVVVTPHSYKRGVFTLFVDEEPWKEIHSTVFGRRPSVPKTFDTMIDLEQWYDEESFKKGKVYAYRRLSQKSYLSNQLQKALVERCVPKGVACKVVNECIGYGYVNDEDWVGSFIRGRLRKGDGPRSVIQRLRAKGVDEAQAREALEEQDSDEDRQERIRALLEKALAKYPKQKAIASVIRKGYDSHDVLSAIPGKILNY